MKQNKIIYLHGFLSSPQSCKAQLTQRWFAQNRPEIEIICPQLESQPGPLQSQLVQLLESHQNQLKGFIGSSLGGYLAAWCSHQTGLPAVLVNPAAYPWRLLKAYLGAHQNPYSGECFTVTEAFNSALKVFDKTPERQQLMVLLQTGDEVLDYREAEQKYQGSLMQVITGGDHAFSGFSDYLPNISQFLLSKSS